MKLNIHCNSIVVFSQTSSQTGFQAGSQTGLGISLVQFGSGLKTPQTV